MTYIEVKRKELETAKRIREMGSDGHCAICDGVSCDEDNCPFVVLCTNSRGSEVTPDFVKGFISTREAEIAALEETPTDTASTVCPVCQGEGTVSTMSDRFQGCRHNIASTGASVRTHDGTSYPVAPVGTGMPILTPSPTLDDFALALIQGGYFNMTMGEDAAISNLVSRAEKIKAALDARRGA